MGIFCGGMDFNPLRPRGRRPGCQQPTAEPAGFQPTPPARTETRWADTRYPTPGFQPTPPARTETAYVIAAVRAVQISTHSAREDGDDVTAGLVTLDLDFNPLRPRGRRQPTLLRPSAPYRFQPTPPARTETAYSGNVPEVEKISTHSAREDGDPSRRGIP